MAQETRELKFIVSGQKIKKDAECDFSNIVAGTRGYLVASFRFTKEWNDMKKIAVFSALGEGFSAAINSKGKCYIPDDALVWSTFDVSVIGQDNKRKYVCTDKVSVEQKVVR